MTPTSQPSKKGDSHVVYDTSQKDYYWGVTLTSGKISDGTDTRDTMFVHGATRHEAVAEAKRQYWQEYGVPPVKTRVANVIQFTE